MKHRYIRFVWLLFLLPLVAGCGGGGSEEPQPQDNNDLKDKDFEDFGQMNDQGDFNEEDEQDDIRFEGTVGTVNEDTTFTSAPVDPAAVPGEAADLAADAGAILHVSADHDVSGPLTVSLRVGTWDGPGIGGSLWGVVLAREDGQVYFAREQELTMDEESGDSWLEFTLLGSDVFTPTYIIVTDFDVEVTAVTTALGVENPDAEAGGEVVTEVTWEAEDATPIDGVVLLNVGRIGWVDDSGDSSRTFSFDSTFEDNFEFVCDGATDTGPEALFLVSPISLTLDGLFVGGGGAYLVNMHTAATCAGAPPVTLGDLPGADQNDRIVVDGFADIDTSGGFVTTLGYAAGAAVLDQEAGAVVIDLDFLSPSRIGAVAFSTGTMLQGVQDDALISYGNDGYGITGYDPVAGIFGATQVDPSSGSVSDVDTFEEDASRGVVVQSGRNRVVSVEHVTSQFGNYFAVQGPSIPSTLFPGATGFVISAARRNQTTPVYFVTVGATADDPGTLWRKDNPADLVTHATAIGQVGNAPRRIRFLKSIGIVSNSFSDTLTILVRDASDDVTIKGTVDVGDGPIGIDLLELPDGNIGVVSAGFLGNTYTVTILEPDGDVVSNVTAPVPNGGDKPSCALWANALGTRIAVSCSGSGEMIILPVQ